MANVVTINITSGGSPVTSGSYDLRVSPYSSSGIAGSHSGGGNWTFASVDDTASYKLYNTAAGTEVTSITGGGTNTLSFYDTDLGGVVKTTGTQTIGGDKTFSSPPKSSTAASATTELMRYDETVRTSGNQTGIAGTKVVTGSWSYSPSTFTISGDGQFTSKKYVDDLFGSAVGVIQSTYMIKCLPSRTTEDIYAKQTVEKCNTYLSALTDISTRTGTILIEPLAQASNLINLDDGTSQWISAGVYIEGVGSKPILNRRAPNSSLTVAGGIINCHILDNNVVSARAYTNFTFENCTFDVPDATDVTFTTCKFKGVNKFKSDGGGDLTMSNCTGDIFIYNDSIGTVSITGTQPAQVISTSASNFDY